VKGCLEWQKVGLRPPKTVQVAVEGYRKEMDSVARFVEEQCIRDPKGEESSRELYGAYSNWCSDNGELKFPQNVFGQALADHGFQRKKSSKRRGWAGIRVRALEDDLAA
jgi:putative DNA primase/helicase